MQFILGVLIAIGLSVTLVSVVLGNTFGDHPMLWLWAKRWLS
jgi:hypothetical protein